MSKKPTIGSRFIAWVSRLACLVGSHDWDVIESRIEHNIETAHCRCTRSGCTHEEVFTTALTPDTWHHRY